MKARALSVLALAATLSFCIASQGCSSQTETTVTRSDPAYSDSAYPSSTSTTTTTTTTTDEPDSVLGATAHAIGTIILFPFRLVGDAISLIV